jgi:adenine-specific DNA methylase
MKLFNTARPIRIELASGKRITANYPSDEQWLALRRRVDRRREEADTVAAMRDLVCDIATEIVGTLTADEYVVACGSAIAWRTLTAAKDSSGTSASVWGSPSLLPDDPQLIHAVRLFRPGDARRIARLAKNRDYRGLGAMYDEFLISASGYVGAVPLAHKVSVVSEVLALCGGRS